MRFFTPPLWFLNRLFSKKNRGKSQKQKKRLQIKKQPFRVASSYVFFLI